MLVHSDIELQFINCLERYGVSKYMVCYLSTRFILNQWVHDLDQKGTFALNKTHQVPQVNKCDQINLTS